MANNLPRDSILTGDCIETVGSIRISIEASKPDEFDEAWLETLFLNRWTRQVSR